MAPATRQIRHISALQAPTWALLIVLLSRGRSAGLEIDAGTDWCRALRTLPPGQELVLRTGEYPGACTIRRGGTASAPVIVRGKDRQHPPKIVYRGDSDNVVNVRADHVTLRGLQFGPTRPGVDAIRIHEANDVTIEDNTFLDIGGIAVVANETSVGIRVRRNTIRRSAATAMYFGCHDGIGCTVSELLIERNHIEAVDAPEDEIGYGIQVKLNSTATISGNIVVNTKGPGVMVYGATDLLRASFVERNVVVGSRTSSAIVVGGGPAIVRNNIALFSEEAGIALEDYGHRRLLRAIAVAHNTVYGNARGGILVAPNSGPDIKVVNNAVHGPFGALAFPAPRAGLFTGANVHCASVPCFLDPVGLNFSPIPGSSLIAAGYVSAEPWMPREDYFGRTRALPGTVGAIEPPGAPLSLGTTRATGAR